MKLDLKTEDLIASLSTTTLVYASTMIRLAMATDPESLAAAETRVTVALTARDNAQELLRNRIHQLEAMAVVESHTHLSMLEEYFECQERDREAGLSREERDQARNTRQFTSWFGGPKAS